MVGCEHLTLLSVEELAVKKRREKHLDKEEAEDGKNIHLLE